jgi:hypothetical protein
MNRLLRLSVWTFSLLSSVFLTSNAMAHTHHHQYPTPITQSFGSFYTDATSTVASSAIIPLSVTQASSSDVSMDGSGVITLNTPGYYYVDFGASQSSAGDALQVQLAIGGVLVPGAILASFPVPAGVLSSSSIIHVAEAGTLLTLVNANTTTPPFPLTLGNGIISTPTAFVSLWKISN